MRVSIIAQQGAISATPLHSLEAVAVTPQPAVQRPSYAEEAAELRRLHFVWVGGGGRVIGNSTMAFLDSLRGDGGIEEGNAARLESRYWGDDIDLSLIKNWRDHYDGVVGQMRFGRDLSIITGCFIQMPFKSFRCDEALQDLFERKGWRTYIRGTWQFCLHLAFTIRRLEVFERYVGFEGLSRFASDHCSGDERKTRELGKIIFDEAEQKRLAWPTPTEVTYRKLLDKAYDIHVRRNDISTEELLYEAYRGVVRGRAARQRWRIASIMCLRLEMYARKGVDISKFEELLAVHGISQCDARDLYGELLNEAKNEFLSSQKALDIAKNRGLFKSSPVAQAPTLPDLYQAFEGRGICVQELERVFRNPTYKVLSTVKELMPTLHFVRPDSLMSIIRQKTHLSFHMIKKGLVSFFERDDVASHTDLSSAILRAAQLRKILEEALGQTRINEVEVLLAPQ